ncbi:MAG: nucleoside triphosphate pyrophosphohydrolase family protein [Ruminiclostridium sp.]|nr:nucleoside triphosphate pyrophosphohydrolase family protein [Ruminiclostridium sp.]
MTANDYQRAALRTAWTKTNEDLPVKILAMKESGAFDKNELLLLNGVLGLSGESGEASDLVKKWIFQGHELVHQQVAEELCDVAWYLAISAHALGYTLDDIFRMNVDKLMERYPDGFSKERSIHR